MVPRLNEAFAGNDTVDPDEVTIPLLLEACLPFPLLSFHVVMLLPDKVSVERSAASNHKAHPGIVVGENPE